VGLPEKCPLKGPATGTPGSLCRSGQPHLPVPGMPPFGLNRATFEMLPICGVLRNLSDGHTLSNGSGLLLSSKCRMSDGRGAIVGWRGPATSGAETKLQNKRRSRRCLSPKADHREIDRTGRRRGKEKDNYPTGLAA
jgi:hypothetical protein